MEPRNESKNEPSRRTDGSKSRFQIVKLEERIAPKHNCYPYGCPPRGHCGHGGCK